MKLSTEAKLGITAVLSVFVIIWGINYLKSINIFSSKYRLVSLYQEVNGLEESALVTMNGYKIGTVSGILFETDKQVPFTVHMDIDKKYRLKKGSIAEIYSGDLLGTMEIRILPSNAAAYYSDKDTLQGRVKDDMISSLLNDIKPVTHNLASAIETLDSTAKSIRKLIQDPALEKTLENLSRVSADLKDDFQDSGDIGRIIANLKDVTGKIRAQSDAVEQSMQNIASISSDLAAANLDSLIASLTETSNNLSLITGAIQSGEGSMGKLIYEDSLYQQLNLLLADLDSLIIDVNENPKKYVSFSLFGK